MQIRTIRKGFEAFERDSLHSNPNSNHSKKTAKANWIHSKGIRSIGRQTLTIQTELEPFERDSKHSNANSKHSKGIRMQIQTN